MNDLSYINWNSASDGAIADAIGAFVKAHRVRQNMSQDDVAAAAGMSRSTVSLLERGQTVRLDTLIQVLRVLDLVYVLEVFNPPSKISPIEYAKLKKKERKRARNQSNNAPPANDLEW